MLVRSLLAKPYRLGRGRRTARCAGVSLVELLVVIAIISILLTVLVPITVQSRNRARTVACLSNLHQIGAALIAYAQDWDDRLPTLGSTPFASSAPTDRWPEGSSATELRAVIRRYVGSDGVYRCGNDHGAPEFGFSTIDGSVFSRTGSSYVPWITARPGRYGLRINGEKTGLLSPASERVLIRDYGSSWHGFHVRSGLQVEARTVANAAFADGHSAAVSVYTFSVADHEYACVASGRREGSGTVSVVGGSGDVEAQLSGTRRVAASGDLEQPEMRLSLSGLVSGGGIDYEVDKVFVFSNDTTLDAAFRQVVAWADSLVAR